MYNFFAFIQARTTSSRLPGKVLKSIGDKPILSHIIDRLCKVIERKQIVLLIPKGDVKLIEYAKNNSLEFFKRKIYPSF